MVNDSDNGRAMDRRQWLTRLAKAGGAIGLLWAAGFWLGRRGDGPAVSATPSFRFPVCSIPGMAGKLVAVTGGNRAEALEKALAALGGIESFIHPADRVLLKVNAAFASPPLIGATTHPELVAELIRLCRKAGAGEVLVADNPINDPTSCFALTGIEGAARKAGGTVVMPGPRDFKPLSLQDGRCIDGWPVFCRPFNNINKIIGLAPLKDHFRSGASMTMKNWYGLLGGRRNVLHQDIHRTIMELSRMVTPTFVILDGTVALMQNGPTGGSLSDLKQTGTLIVGTDQVAVDALGAGLLEKDLQTLGFIRQAEAAGSGTADYRSLNPVFISL
ncbi:MAG: DUF362 domain-containing protein [Thermodesulfobacteriota bacterium]